MDLLFNQSHRGPSSMLLIRVCRTQLEFVDASIGDNAMEAVNNILAELASNDGRVLYQLSNSNLVREH